MRGIDEWHSVVDVLRDVEDVPNGPVVRYMMLR